MQKKTKHSAAAKLIAGKSFNDAKEAKKTDKVGVKEVKKNVKDMKKGCKDYGKD